MTYAISHAAEYPISPDFDLYGAQIAKAYNPPPPPPSSTPDESQWQGYALLERIAACESTGDPNGTPRQFLPDGSVLWGNDPVTGKPVKRDEGILQINSYVWGRLAASMGDDLATEAGNLAFGKWLFDEYGAGPWSASEECWK